MNGPVPLYILAGGKSSRFGTDKARAPLNGQPLICGLVRALEPLVSSVTVVARKPGLYADLGFRTIGDLLPGLGPLGGLRTALDDLTCPDWLLLAACDWAGIRPQWVHQLVRSVSPGSQYVLFRHEFPEPLLALYHRSSLVQVEEHLQAGRLSMQDLISDLRGMELSVPADWHEAGNINRPGDLRPFLHPGATRCR